MVAVFQARGPGTKTRRLRIFSLSVGQSSDAHGTLSVISPHQHAADGADTTMYFFPVHVPSDAVLTTAADMSINYLFSSTAAGNNIVHTIWVDSGKDADATLTTVLSTGAVAVASAAGANTLKKITVPFSGLPGADAFLGALIQFTRTSGSDSNTGQVSLWDVWLEYKASR